MSEDLTLLIVEPGTFFTRTCLKLERRRELWEPIRALPSMAIGEIPLIAQMCFSSFHSPVEGGGLCYGPTEMDAQGEPLRAVQVRAFDTLAANPAVLDNDQNRATWAYLAALQDDWLAVLYWE